MNINIMQFCIMFFALISFFYALGLFLQRHLYSIFLTLHTFFFSLWLACGAFARSDLGIVSHMDVFNFGLIMHSVAISFVYFDFFKTIDQDYKISSRSLVFLFYPVLTIAYIIGFHLNFEPVYSAEGVTEYYYNLRAFSFYGGYPYLSSLIFIVLLSMQILKLRVVKMDSTPESVRIRKLILFTLLFNIIQNLIWIADRVFDLYWLWGLYILSGVSILCNMLVLSYDRDIFEKMYKYARSIKKSYLKPRLQDISVEDKIRQLDDLMIREKVYRDEDISLSVCAELVGMSAHELSEFLNLYLNTNFSVFINSYRIKEAKERLKNEHELIADVCFLVGFNSRSTFNRVFKNEVGLSPSEFIKASTSK